MYFPGGREIEFSIQMRKGYLGEIRLARRKLGVHFHPHFLRIFQAVTNR